MEKMKLIDWYSDSSNNDGSHLVCNKKSMKKKNNTRKSASKTRFVLSQSVDGKASSEGHDHKVNPRYNLRKSKITKQCNK
jgi:hypothetical protein